MALLERLHKKPVPTVPKDKTTEKKAKAKPKASSIPHLPTAALRADSKYHELKEKIHRRLIERLDLSKLDTISKDALITQVREVVENLLQQEADVIPN